MLIQKEHFRLWFRDIIESLYHNKNAGFVLLMITFPLLERYLRSKSGINEGILDDRFYSELRILFPVLKANDIAKIFWQVYRNGVLHQDTLSQRDIKGNLMPCAWLSGNCKDVEIDSSDAFHVNPVEFAKRVIDVIEKDFSNFEAANSLYHPLPIVKKMPNGFDGTTSTGARILSGDSGKFWP